MQVLLATRVYDHLLKALAAEYEAAKNQSYGVLASMTANDDTRIGLFHVARGWWWTPGFYGEY